LREDQYPDELFYGYIQLSRRPGWTVTLRERRNSWLPGLFLQRALHSVTHFSPDFGAAPELNEALLHAYDAIISTSEPVLAMLGFRRRERGSGARLILFVMGAEKRIRRSKVPSLTRRLLRSSLGRMDAVIVIGEGERDYLLAQGLAPAERVRLVQFGVDLQFWSPLDHAEGAYVLAVGNDDGRDYDLLLRAIGTHPLRLHTRLPVDAPRLPPNVTLSGGTWHDAALSDEDLRDLYRRSRFVVVPLLDSSQPQGQSVTLQAMACGKAVVLSRTRGLWSRDLMRHGENCHLVPAGDLSALRQAIDFLIADPAYARRLGLTARKTVEDHFGSDRMAEDLAAIVTETAR
jgi:glycosyltransferase involved in cell wall biosynthesis